MNAVMVKEDIILKEDMVEQDITLKMFEEILREKLDLIFKQSLTPYLDNTDLISTADLEEIGCCFYENPEDI